MNLAAPSDLSRGTLDSETTVGVPNEDIQTRHDAFDASALALIDQAASHGLMLGRKAYQLLLEMHVHGAPAPVHMQLPSITWELQGLDRTLSVSIEVMFNRWDILLNGVNALGIKRVEDGHVQGTAREVADYVFRAFENLRVNTQDEMTFDGDEG